MRFQGLLKFDTIMYWGMRNTVDHVIFKCFLCIPQSMENKLLGEIMQQLMSHLSKRQVEFWFLENF